MSRTRKTTHHQRGFTLVEIMVVILILGLLATIVGTNVVPFFTQSQEDKARFDVGKVDEAIELYYLQNQEVPELQDLIDPDERTGQAMLKGYTEVPSDPWNNPYEIRKGDTPSTWEVISWGPDKAPDTDDDISSKNIKDRKRRN